ncbi:phage head morphogenesis protein [Salinisphaera orenii]|uniref:phage head morphogenesis protein n=1 Tax=Salinisphaera orenii TaxID=856731 RepID=UPI000DBE2D29
MAETRTPGPVPKDALAYFKAKDLRPGFSHEDVWADEHAHAFTVAKMTRLDLLEDTRASLEAALAEGKTFRQWANEIRPQLEKKGWWGIKERTDPATGITERVQLGSPRRLKTIYRANMRSARAAGQWQRIQRTKDSRPYLIYLLGPSEHHRPEHVDLQGLTLPVDDPTWSEIYPPNGYGCACHINQIDKATRDQYAADGVPDATAGQEIDPETGQPTGRRITRQVPAKTRRPELKRKRYVNKRTGEIQYAPKGVHPAWANNSGQARVRVLREALSGKLETADQQLARASVNTIADSPVLAQFLDDASDHKAILTDTKHEQFDKAERQRVIDSIGDLPIAYADRELATYVGSQTQLVRLSAESAGKQSLRHSDIDAALYQSLDELLATGEVLRRDDRTIVVFGNDSSGAHLRAVLKRAGRDNKELFLSTFHRVDEGRREKARETMKRLRASR